MNDYALYAPPPCAKAQLYGEYLHAYMDTFAHRDWNNAPYPYGRSQAAGLTAPDRTYNSGIWQVNEPRAFEMEQQVFAALQRDFGRQALVEWTADGL